MMNVGLVAMAVGLRLDGFSLRRGAGRWGRDRDRGLPVGVAGRLRLGALPAARNHDDQPVVDGRHRRRKAAPRALSGDWWRCRAARLSRESAARGMRFAGAQSG